MAFSDPVELGEDFMTVAAANGFPNYKTLVEHKQNQDRLIKMGRSAGMLARGDQVYLPDEAKDKSKSAKVGQINVHQVETPPALLRIRINHFAGEPVDGEAGTISYASQGMNQTLNIQVSKGVLECEIPLAAKTATLKLPGLRREWELKIGYLEPAVEALGSVPKEVAARAVQARLNNLAFECGDVDAVVGLRTTAALKDFQLWKNLKGHDGKINGETNKALHEPQDQK